MDIWRKTHPLEKKFTWRQETQKKFARLDYFLMSESLLDIFAESSIKTRYKSDHSPICLKLFISKSPRGRGVWKLNNSLLLDNDLIDIITNEIELMVSIYACTPYHPDFVNNYRTENLEFMIEIISFGMSYLPNCAGLL